MDDVRRTLRVLCRLLVVTARVTWRVLCWLLGAIVALA
jgi:hypothetical protein